MIEAYDVVLARIEERLIALGDKVDDHHEVSLSIHERQQKDISSLKTSRAWAKGVGSAVVIAIAGLELERFW